MQANNAKYWIIIITVFSLIARININTVDPWKPK